MLVIASEEPPNLAGGTWPPTKGVGCPLFWAAACAGHILPFPTTWFQGCRRYNKACGRSLISSSLSSPFPRDRRGKSDVLQSVPSCFLGIPDAIGTFPGRNDPSYIDIYGPLAGFWDISNWFKARPLCQPEELTLVLKWTDLEPITSSFMGVNLN